MAMQPAVLLGAVRDERQPPGQDLERQHAQRVHVAGRADRLRVAPLLWRHVRPRAERDAGPRDAVVAAGDADRLSLGGPDPRGDGAVDQAGRRVRRLRRAQAGELGAALGRRALGDLIEGLGDAEVEQLGQQAAAALDHHDVRRLDVAVDDAALVRGVHRVRHALEERDELVEWHRPVLLEPRGQRDALNQLHRDPEQVGVLVHAKRVDVSGERVVEARCELRLAQKPLIRHVIVLPQHLDDNVTLEQRLLGPIDGAVPALPDLLEQNKLA
ncbi:MAG TPA: hypothetical protein VHW23_40965 [Kofleriaceae bacterium]|nr:hypothetical protein [Kofleriaceae bacterium]